MNQCRNLLCNRYYYFNYEDKASFDIYLFLTFLNDILSFSYYRTKPNARKDDSSEISAQEIWGSPMKGNFT